jgi:hypothetical protein
VQSTVIVVEKRTGIKIKGAEHRNSCRKKDWNKD